MRALTALLALVAAASVGSEPRRGEAPGRPDLVLVTLDTLRADRVGAYGDPRARTPRLDALAARGALFREATTPIPLTLPAHASILSGLYPQRHGLRDNGGFRLDPSVPLVAEALQRAGYRTGAFVGAYVLDASWGLARGFDHYHDGFAAEDVARAPSFGLVEHEASRVVGDAVTWWEGQESPRFLWVHLFDAHRPYEPPAGWSGDPYRGEVAELDRALAALFRVVGEDVVLIVAADHGEGLWDGGELEHGLLLSRSVTRVPLIVRPPGGLEGRAAPAVRAPVPRPSEWAPVPGLGPDGLDLSPVPDAPRAARVVDTPVSLVDVAPTLLDYAGLGCPVCDGRSLRSAVEGKPLEARPVFSESAYATYHFGWAPSFLVRSERRLLVRDPQERLTDPFADPWAQHALSEDASELAALLDAHGVGWEERPIRWEEGPFGIDAGRRARLAALGYATAVVAAPATDTLPRAAERTSVLHRMFLAQGKMVSAPHDARRELEAVVADEPGLIDVWLSLAQLRINAGEAEGALAALEQVLSRAPNHTGAARLQLVVLRAAGRYAEALAVVERMRLADPSDLHWIQQRVDLEARRRDPHAVLRAAAEGLALAPDDAYLHTMSGLAKLELGDATGSLEHFAAARGRDQEAKRSRSHSTKAAPTHEPTPTTR